MFIDMHFRKYFIFVVSRGVLIVQIMEQNTSIIKQLMKKLDFANISFDIGHSNEEYLVTFQDKEKRAEIIIFSANLESDIHFLMQVVLINHRTDILIRSPTKIWTFDGFVVFFFTRHNLE
uniref:CSON001141 protein n=1 Tax=Culicoides sonorensis TaxID=179676 RepID=A0A336MTN3_CULSO